MYAVSNCAGTTVRFKGNGNSFSMDSQMLEDLLDNNYCHRNICQIFMYQKLIKKQNGFRDLSRERENRETVKFETYGRTVKEKHKLSSISIKAFFTKMMLFLHFWNTEIRVILGENVSPLSLFLTSSLVAVSRSSCSSTSIGSAVSFFSSSYLSCRFEKTSVLCFCTLSPFSSSFLLNYFTYVCTPGPLLKWQIWSSFTQFLSSFIFVFRSKRLHQDRMDNHANIVPQGTSSIINIFHSIGNLTMKTIGPPVIG